jgi:hypothetical protein
VAPSPGGETDDHRRLRISSSGFESWSGCHLVVAQWSRALPSEGRGHWFESSRRGVAAIAQLEERSLGTTEVPGSAPGGGSEAVRPLYGGLTERKGARLLSEGRGQPRQRSIRCPSAQEGMPRWLGAPCFENSDTVLPWGFDTSTFRSDAVVQRKHAGLSIRRLSDQDRPASPGRHRIMASPPGSQPGSRGSVPRGGTTGGRDLLLSIAE